MQSLQFGLEPYEMEHSDKILDHFEALYPYVFVTVVPRWTVSSRIMVDNMPSDSFELADQLEDLLDPMGSSEEESFGGTVPDGAYVLTPDSFTWMENPASGEWFVAYLNDLDAPCAVATRRDYSSTKKYPKYTVYVKSTADNDSETVNGTAEESKAVAMSLVQKHVAMGGVFYYF